MRNSKTKLVLESLVVAGLLAACGGGGGGDASSSASGANNQTVVTSFTEGSYIGTSTSTDNSSFNLLILENGQYWEIYGTQTTAGFSIAGLIQGTSTASNGNFSSPDAKDFGATPARSATIAGTYNTTAKTITGKFIIPSLSLNIDFSAGPDTATLYNYATPAKLSTLTGAWTLTDTSGENLTVNIADSGAFTGTYATGCTVSGTVATRASGKNVFNTTMQFGPAPCSLPNQTASGIAVAYPLASGQTQAIFMQVDSTRSYGSVAFGVR